ncbi:hypothetical protein F7725_023411, partial [Dissostichus mawsoni]
DDGCEASSRQRGGQHLTSECPYSPQPVNATAAAVDSVKMADCIRVPLLLLLLCIFSSLHPIQCQNNPILAKVPVNPVLNAPLPPRLPVPEKIPGGGASLPRKRSSTGWKLSEEGVCKEDLTRLCPKHSWNNNLAVLECLQDKKEVRKLRLQPNATICWNYKLNLTTDPKFESVAVEGEVIACLEKGLVREAEQQPGAHPIKDECKKSIMRVAELSSDDFHLDRYLYFSCREDRERFCENTLAGEGRVYKCLFNHKFEEAMSEKCREALTTRQKLIAQDYKVSYSLAKACKSDLRKYRCSADSNVPRAREARLSYLLLCLESCVSGECQGEMMDYRRMLMEDFSLSPEIVLHCRSEIEGHCSGLHRKGRTLHCLMRVGRGDMGAIDPNCQRALQTLIQEADPGSDYRIDRALNEACESDPVVSDGASVHEKMVEDCEHRLLELQYFIARDWKDCKVEVQRILHQRALDVKLDPELQRRCMTDLGKWCSEKTDPGQELECLQDHLEELVSDCRDVACEPVIQTYCHIQIKDFRFSYKFKTACKEDVLKLVDVVICLSTTVRNDTLQDVKEQRVSIKCRKQLRVEEVEMVIECLKENKRQLTQRCHQKIFKLQEVEMSAVSLPADYRLNPVLRKAYCEAQIQVILQESALDYRLDPQLQIHCTAEISRLCPEEAAAQEQTGQVEECLKVNLLKIKQDGCKKEVLNMLKESKADIFVDPVLHTACALDIKHQCAAIPPGRGRQMSCLMEALQDKRVRLQPECKKRLQDRIDMWSYAAKVAPAEGFSDLAMQVMTSPSKNYILTVISAGVALLFVMGLLCGRFTKRVTQELKDR